MSVPTPSAMPDTLPTGFDPAGFVGEVSADGQHGLFDPIEPPAKHRRRVRPQPQPVVVQQLTLW